MPKFQEIEQMSRAKHSFDQSWGNLENWLASEGENGLNIEPDFQRAHVWTLLQRSAYVEYALRGGLSGRDIYFNCPNWNQPAQGKYTDFTIVDGKQRLQTVRMFLRDEVPIFDGYLYSDYTDRLDWLRHSFRFHMNVLQTEAEVIKWYLDMNSAGTQHTEAELARVRAMLQEKM